MRAATTNDGRTTDDDLDLAATLLLVISDTDAVYLYGLDILVEQLVEAERYHYVHDGLGSVRHPSARSWRVVECPIHGTSLARPGTRRL